MRLVAYTDAGAVGGAELALGYLLGALAPDIEVALLAMSREVGETIAERRPGTPVRTVPAPRGEYDRAALGAHVRAIRALEPDVLHVNQAWPWDCGYAVLAGLLLPGVRVLVVDHLPVAGSIPRPRLLGRRLMARRLDAHVSVGEKAARMIEDMVGLRPGSVRAVPNGVPARRVAEPPPALAPVPVIGSLGRLTHQKGYDLLVRALPELPGATLVLVGDGPERAALETLAAELGVTERLVITGWTPDARAHLQTFDVFALTSRWEGMPLSILEAMHAARPVVATEVGSVAEAVIQGETGYVVPPGDDHALREALAPLIGDAELRRRLGERGREIAAERFTDEAMARRYEEIYRTLKPAPRASSRSAR